MRSNRATNTDILPLLTRAEIASGLQKDEYLFSSLTNVRSVEAQLGFHHQGLREVALMAVYGLRRSALISVYGPEA